MDKLDNPYFSLLEIMQNQSPTIPENFMVGTVLSSEPLNVEVAGNIILTQSDMLINNMLLAKYNRKVSIKTSNITEDGEITTLDDSIKPGDKVVLLLSKDQQQFILLAKVV